MRQAQAVAEQHRGTAITLTFLTRTGLSSLAEAITLMVPLLACSVSLATTTVAVAAATARSVRSWSHFNVTLDLALCKSAQILNYLSTQITGSNLKMEYSYKKVLRSKTFYQCTLCMLIVFYVEKGQTKHVEK